MTGHLLGLLMFVLCIPQLFVAGLVTKTSLSVGGNSITAKATTHHDNRNGASSMLIESTTKASPDASPNLSVQEEQVYSLLKELSDSKLLFRIVVVGNGAILESSNLLGPTLKVSPSPATGANLATFASEDQSFELHLIIAQISKVVMIEKPSPVVEGKIMRIMRFLNNDDKSICSLILADESVEAVEWYQEILSKYGPEMKIE